MAIKECCKDKSVPKGKQPYAWCGVCGRDLSEPQNAPQSRSVQQNKAIHLYCELLSEAFNSAGLDMKAVLKPNVDIPWSKTTVKEYIWRPIQKAQLKKKSTTELTTSEVSAVFDTINRHISEKFGVSVPFPTDEMVE